MLQEIAAGIYQIRLPLPWSVDFMPFSPATVNLYLVQRGHRVLLVDTGYNSAECRETLRTDLAKLGLDVSGITDLVITHFHADHIGLMDVLVDAVPAAHIHMHAADVDMVRRRYFRPRAAMAELRSWLSGHGLPADDGADVSAIRLHTGQFTGSPACTSWRSPSTRELDLDGQVWQLLWTAGHTPGHLVLYGPNEGILLAGDSLMASTTSNVSKHPGSSDNPLLDYRSSLALLNQLPVAEVWPGHGKSFADLSDRVATTLHQQDRKLARLLESLGGDTVTGYEIAGRLWARGGTALNANSRRLALTETMALLAWLESTGAVISRADDAGLTRYAAVGG
jgi:glyoxylase-like metal-dependent hydrolase (beta-lactamase superfamily II)